MKNLFGQYLNNLRCNRGLTVRQLSSKTGLSASHISNIENGVRMPPKQEALIIVSKALGLTNEEKTKLINLALQVKSGHQDIPEEVLLYISKNHKTIDVIKLGEKLNYNDFNWENIINYMNK